MDKQVMLAVAGAGKTFYICNTINPKKRNLILAFTNENIQNIRNELMNAYGSIPELTSVMTFDSFIYRNLICPYEPSIGDYFFCPSFVSSGICTMTPPPKGIKNKYGKTIHNRKYISKEKIGHYITNNKQYYCSTLSELVMEVKQGGQSLVKRASERLNLFFDKVLIDEFQDFREFDYELIIAVSKYLNNVLLVGDYYQHSVSATNNSGKPFKNRTRYIGYSEFVDEVKQAGFIVDEKTLDKSRRCSSEICEYVKKKLDINIESTGDNTGSVIWSDDNAYEIINDPEIVKLVFNDASNYKFNAMNWSYSKGDTLNSACVILTEKFEKMCNENFSTSGLSVSTINKLYVAMTRSSGNLYLIKASTFKKIKDNYKISNFK